MFNSLLFSSAAQTEMKRWRVAGAGLSGLFIRYYNLRVLRGQGQRWLLFARYFMAGEIIDPRGVHLVHMEVLQREWPFVARNATQQINKGQTRTVRKGYKGRQEPTFPSFCRTVKSDLTGCRFVGRAVHVTTSWVSRAWAISETAVIVRSGWARRCQNNLPFSAHAPALCPSQAVIRYSGLIVEQTTRGSPAAQE